MLKFGKKKGKKGGDDAALPAVSDAPTDGEAGAEGEEGRRLKFRSTSAS